MPPKQEYSLRETSPDIGARNLASTDKLTLVEQRHFLYVHIVRSKDLPGSCNPFVEIKIGNYRGTTRFLEQNPSREWNQVFAFTKDRLQGGVIEITVRTQDFENDDFIGCIKFDLGDIPTRIGLDSQLAPQWYRLEDRTGVKVRGELMVALWIGNQADDAFSIAWHSDSASVDNVANTRGKVYHSPRLWYLRIQLLQAQDLVTRDMNRRPEVFVRAILGSLVLRSRISSIKDANPVWNEELIFVAAEPFDDPLILSVEDKNANNKEECLGRCVLPLPTLERRVGPPGVGDRWINLERYPVNNKNADVRFASRLHLKVFLDGVYHVFDEPTYYSSDIRATSPILWPPKIGILELGILKAEGLLPMKSKGGRGAADAYCVAKYGDKWVRTSTIVDSFAPNWNEQYYWDVYDPCTVITIGVFDNSQLLQGGAVNTRDPRIGKVRIRLSTLEANRIYTHSYPLLVLQSNGLKKMGELHLAIKFSCTSFSSCLWTYIRPLLPEMHYISPLSVYHLDSLRHQATYILSLRLGRADPPLRKEVVEYMLEAGANSWSLRRARANCERVLVCLRGVVAFCRWFNKVRDWNDPITSVMFFVLGVILIWFPRVILPMVLVNLFVSGILNYVRRPRHPPHMDTKLSHAETAHYEELDEELDTFPTSKNGEVLKKRYDQLRSIGGRVMVMIGDVATQLERLNSIVTWRDPRATFVFLIVSVPLMILFYKANVKPLMILAFAYVMRPPSFRRVPSAMHNFLRRLPARTDAML